MVSEIQPHERAVHKYSFKRIMANNFVGGVFWALGVTIGFSLLLALLTLLSSYINLVPIVGKFTSDIIDFVLSNNSSIPRP